MESFVWFLSLCLSAWTWFYWGLLPIHLMPWILVLPRVFFEVCYHRVCVFFTVACACVICEVQKGQVLYPFLQYRTVDCEDYWWKNAPLWDPRPQLLWIGDLFADPYHLFPLPLERSRTTCFLLHCSHIFSVSLLIICCWGCQTLLIHARKGPAVTFFSSVFSIQSFWITESAAIINLFSLNHIDCLLA